MRHHAYQERNPLSLTLSIAFPFILLSYYIIKLTSCSSSIIMSIIHGKVRG